MKLPLHRDHAARLRRELHAATHIVRDLQALEQLGRDHTPDNDGYPHGGSSDGARGSDTTSSTERAALTPVDGSTRALGDAIEHFLAASKHLAAAHAKLAEYRTPRTPPAAGRTSTVTTCPACGELALPRVIAGYCPKCYEAWRTSGMGDRAAFEHARTTRAQRAEGAA